MPKLKNITNEELRRVADLAMDVSQEAAHLNRVAEQGYLDDVESPINMASTFLSAAASLYDVGRTLIIKASLQEQKRELEEKLRKPK